MSYVYLEIGSSHSISVWTITPKTYGSPWKKKQVSTQRGRYQERPGSLSGLSCIDDLAFSETFLPSREKLHSLVLLLRLSQALSAN